MAPLSPSVLMLLFVLTGPSLVRALLLPVLMGVLVKRQDESFHTC